LTALPASPAAEADYVRLWAAGLPPPLRLEDGRALQVIFPGIPGGGAGPDFSGAILDAAGDLLSGDIEIHIRASGWRAHGHDTDPAYAAVALHVVSENDASAPFTLHRSGRLIPVLVLPPLPPAFPPPFTPPCALEAARGRLSGAALERLGIRRLRMKAARAAPQVVADGPGQALYSLLLETLGGPSNRAPFATLARSIPLGVLLEALDGSTAPRAFAAAAHLKGATAALVVRRAGLRPMASPARRLEAAGAIIARLWPRASLPRWPAGLTPEGAVSLGKVSGIGAALARELLVNAVFPVALAAGRWPEDRVLASYIALPSPGTYGKLRSLEGWLGSGGTRPFPGAARLQGALLLHADYCTRGRCGRCPLSD
jgi:hypothetical protein